MGRHNAAFDIKCKAKCPYHCKSWMVGVGGYDGVGFGHLEDKTLTLKVGK